MATGTKPRYRRRMSGSSSRLAAHYAQRQHKSTTETEVPYRRATVVDLDVAMAQPAGTMGSVRVWRTVVLHQKENFPAREFAPASGAEVWTLNGQTHVTRSDAHFRSKRVGLDALVGRLLVEVELDGLSRDAKAEVVTTARYTRAQKEIGTRLDEAIDEVLSDDDDLKRLNEQIREEAFKRAASQRIAGLDAALRAFGLTFQRMQKVNVPGGEKGKRPRPEPSTPPPIHPLHPYPRNVFRFRTALRERIRVKRGSTASIQLEADAVDGYFDEASRLSLQFVPSLGEKLRIVGQDSLVDGRMRIRMKAARDAPLAEVVLHASCVTPRGILNAEIPVEVVEPAPSRGPSPTKHGQSEIEMPVSGPPRVEVHYENDKEHPWPTGWTAKTVGEFAAGVAHVNGDFEELVKLRRDLPASQHSDITNVYIAPVAMSIVGLEDAESEPPKNEKGEDVPLHGHYRDAALRAAALSSIFAIRYMRKAGMVLEGDEEPTTN